MDVTGRRSTDGIREYKEVCLDQRKALSNIIQNPRKKEKHDVEPQEAKPNSVSAMQGVQKTFSFSGSIQNLAINFQGKG